MRNWLGSAVLAVALCSCERGHQQCSAEVRVAEMQKQIDELRAADQRHFDFLNALHKRSDDAASRLDVLRSVVIMNRQRLFLPETTRAQLSESSETRKEAPEGAGQ